MNEKQEVNQLIQKKSDVPIKETFNFEDDFNEGFKSKF